MTVRHVRRFLPNSLVVPTPVVDYLAAQLQALRGQGYPVRDIDAARRSVHQHAHLSVHGY